MSETPPMPPMPPMPPAPQTPGGGQPQNGLGTAALVLGIIQFFCFPLLGSILAIILGRMGMKRAEQGLATNAGAAKAGFILGIIGLVLSVIFFILWIVIFANAAKNGDMTITTN